MRACELISTGDSPVCGGQGTHVRMAAAKPRPPSVGACVFVFTGVSGRTCWSVCVCMCMCM